MKLLFVLSLVISFAAQGKEPLHEYKDASKVNCSRQGRHFTVTYEGIVVHTSWQWEAGAPIDMMNVCGIARAEAIDHHDSLFMDSKGWIKTATDVQRLNHGRRPTFIRKFTNPAPLSCTLVGGKEFLIKYDHAVIYSEDTPRFLPANNVGQSFVTCARVLKFARENHQSVYLYDGHFFTEEEYELTRD